MDQLIQLILETIENNVTGIKRIDLGQLPTDGGLVAQLAPSSTDMTFMDKSKTIELNLLFLRKSKNQLECLNDLVKIERYLSGLKNYPNTTDYEWCNALITGYPQYVDKEDNGQYIYSMVVQNTINEL